MNQEVEVGGCQSCGNEVHNEGMFIGDGNAEIFTQWTNKRDIQSPVKVNKESKTLENNFFNIPREFSPDIQESEHKQRECNMDQAVRIHAEYTKFFIPDYFFKKTTPHTFWAWCLMLEKMLRLELQQTRKDFKSFSSYASPAPFHFKARGRVFSNRGRMMQNKSTGWIKKHLGN